MKFQCEACGHLGEAAQIKPVAGGVALVCAECGHENSLGAAPAASAPPAASEAPKAPSSEPSAAPPEPVVPSEEALEAEAAKVMMGATAQRSSKPQSGGLIPSPPPPDPMRALQKSGLKVDVGQGPVRCPKCGYRQQRPTSCQKCGLDLSRPDLGTAPWEKVPPEKADAAQMLDAAWEALLEGDAILDPKAREGFINKASATGLLDRAARRFRFFAQDHDGTERGNAAAESLGRLVERMHVEFVSVQGMGSTKDAYAERAKQVRSGLYVVAILMCLGVVALAMVIFKPF